MKRQYMIDFRKKHDISVRRMAKVCKCSVGLLDMLESYHLEVTHPKIAQRIAAAYKLTNEQYESMLPENYRPSSPNYEPDKYKRDSKFEDFAIY